MMWSQIKDARYASNITVGHPIFVELERSSRVDPRARGSGSGLLFAILSGNGFGESLGVRPSILRFAKTQDLNNSRRELEPYGKGKKRESKNRRPDSRSMTHVRFHSARERITKRHEFVVVLLTECDSIADAT